MSYTLYWKVVATAAGATYDLSRDLSSFIVEEEDRSPTRLTVQISDPFTVFSHAFPEGVSITAELGTDDDHSPVFSGRIYHVDSSLPQDGTPALTIKAYDATMAMGLRNRNRPFRDVHLTDVVRTVAEPYVNGAPLDIAVLGDPLYSGAGLRQREETDLHFLRRLADHAQCTMGMTVGADGGSFVFKPTQTILQGTPTVVMYYGRCDVGNRLLTFNSQSDISQVAVPTTTSAMDPDTGEIIEPRDSQIAPVGETEDELLDDNLAAFEDKHADRGAALRELIDAAESLAPTLRQELGQTRREPVAGFASSDQVIQQGEQQPSATLQGMQGTGTTVGNKDVHARMPLKIEGGGRFSGTWLVTKATHTLDRQGYRTEFSVQR